MIPSLLMKRPHFLQLAYFLATFTFLHYEEQKALGLVNDVVTTNKCRRSNMLAIPTSQVNVWNNVIDTEYLAPKLHGESSRIGLGHKVFSRPRRETTDINVIEQTLDSILTELNDDSKYVEYWTRQEWRSIHAHADVDEYKAKEEQRTGEISDNGFRYPRNGHVLYLQVGSQVRGPTCIFPNRRSGGDLLRKTETDPSTVGGDESCTSGAPGNGPDEEEYDKDVELITVPAVPGRLLRFQGDYLHAVPRPTDFWLLKFVKGSPTFEPEEDWGRSVILFNTWDDEPPLGLPIDEGSVHNDDSSSDNESLERNRHDCNKKHEWSRVDPVPPTREGDDEKEEQCENQESVLSAKVWLLGDYRRRDHPMQTVKLEAGENLREALHQESNVVSTVLKIP